MKTIGMILILVLTLLLAVSLYNTLAQIDTVETVTMEEIYTDPFPDPMPDLIMDQMIGYPVY